MQTLIMDMDNVITDFSEAATEFYNNILDKELTIVDILEFTIWKNYNVDERLGKEIHDKMLGSYEFWQNMPPIRGSINSLRRLNEKYKLAIATMPIYNIVCIHEKIDWIHVHLPFIRDDQLIFLQNKEFLAGDIMVDDDYRNLVKFQGKRILFEQPYNAHTAFELRVSDWEELEELLNGAI